MRKVLIISYFFPPGNFAGSYRIKSWAEHLHKFEYFPIVITRHWEEKDNDFTAISEKKEITKEELGHYLVYRLPYKGSFRDRLVKRFGPNAIWIGKFFSFFQVIGQNFFLRSVPYRNIYDFSRELLRNNPDVKLVITSGRPFVHFRFVYLLKKEFPTIKWVADYRDAWNSDSMIEESFSRRVQRFFEKSREKKWTQNASLITAVSDGLAKELSAFLNKKTTVVYNGFEPGDYLIEGTHEKNPSQFLIVYNGTLYPGQPVMEFLKAFKGVSRTLQGQIDLKLIFAGSKPNKRIEGFIKRNPNLNIFITDRMDKNAVIQLQKSAQLLLMVGHSNQKGIVSSKIFEYFGINKPVFLYPSDNDILARIVGKTQTGFIPNNRDEAIQILKRIISEYLANGFIQYTPQREEIDKFTRENQTKQLASFLDGI